MGGIGRVSKRRAQRSRFVGWTVGATVEEGVGRGSSLSERPRGKRPRESVWGFGVTVPEEEHCLQSAGLHRAFRHAPRRHARVEKNAGLLGPLGRRSGGRDPPNWRPLRRARGLVRLARQTPVRQTGTRCWKGSQDRTPDEMSKIESTRRGNSELRSEESARPREGRPFGGKIISSIVNVH